MELHSEHVCWWTVTGVSRRSLALTYAVAALELTLLKLITRNCEFHENLLFSWAPTYIYLNDIGQQKRGRCVYSGRASTLLGLKVMCRVSIR